MSRNIMLTIAYDGTRYRGWQIQPNGLTVQECVESATEKLTGVRHKVLCAGRTDSGVHAVGQVASLRTTSDIPPAQFRRGLQRFLPGDIAVVNTREVHDDFHATFSAIRKRYRYLLYDGPVVPPFLKNFVTNSRGNLNTAAMREALPALLGTHDFRCFETNYPNKATSVRTVISTTVERIPVWSIWNSDHSWRPENERPHEDPNSPLVCFEITADGFLYNMVRAIIGTLQRIGSERMPPDYMSDVVASMDRSHAGATAPPEGLYLMQVDYPDELLRPAQQDHRDASETEA